MSHGSDDALENRSSGFLAAKPKLRYVVLAVGALLTWLCLETWLSLIYPEYPIGINAGSQTWIKLAAAFVFAAIALAIPFILIRAKATGYVFAYLVFGSLMLVAAHAISGFLEAQTTSVAVKSIAAATVAPFALIAVAFAYASSIPAPVTENLRLLMPEQRLIWAFVLPLAAWFAIGVVWPFTPFNPVLHPDAPDPVIALHRALGHNFSATFIYLAVLVPISEEILFRGLIARLLRNSTNVYIATLLSASIFALFHIDPNYFSFNQVLYVFSLGVVLATSMFATRSIWPGIAVHSLNNALVSLDSIVL